MPLSRFTDVSYINLHLKAANKEGILRELASIAVKSGIINSIEPLFGRLIDRETMLSTALGKGIAIPHPRNPSDELFSHPYVIIARSVKGVDFHAPDGEKTHVFFMPCAPDVIMHLKLLSKISKLLKIKGTLRRFMRFNTGQDVIKFLMENERINLEIK